MNGPTYGVGLPSSVNSQDYAALVSNNITNTKPTMATPLPTRHYFPPSLLSSPTSTIDQNPSSSPTTVVAHPQLVSDCPSCASLHNAYKLLRKERDLLSSSMRIVQDQLRTSEALRKTLHSELTLARSHLACTEKRGWKGGVDESAKQYEFEQETRWRETRERWYNDDGTMVLHPDSYTSETHNPQSGHMNVPAPAPTNSVSLDPRTKGFPVDDTRSMHDGDEGMELQYPARSYPPSCRGGVPIQQDPYTYRTSQTCSSSENTHAAADGAYWPHNHSTQSNEQISHRYSYREDPPYYRQQQSKNFPSVSSTYEPSVHDHQNLQLISRTKHLNSTGRSPTRMYHDDSHNGISVTNGHSSSIAHHNSDTVMTSSTPPLNSESNFTPTAPSAPVIHSTRPRLLSVYATPTSASSYVSRSPAPTSVTTSHTMPPVYPQVEANGYHTRLISAAPALTSSPKVKPESGSQSPALSSTVPATVSPQTHKQIELLPATTRSTRKRKRTLSLDVGPEAGPPILLPKRSASSSISRQKRTATKGSASSSSRSRGRARATKPLDPTKMDKETGRPPGWYEYMEEYSRRIAASEAGKNDTERSEPVDGMDNAETHASASRTKD